MLQWLRDHHSALLAAAVVAKYCGPAGLLLSSVLTAIASTLSGS